MGGQDFLVLGVSESITTMKDMQVNPKEERERCLT